MAIDRPSKAGRMEEQPISFSESDAEGVQQPHDDPLVITVVVGNYKTSRVLIGNGSFADILFVEAFRQMGIPKEKLQPIRSPLVEFSGEFSGEKVQLL